MQYKIIFGTESISPNSQFKFSGVQQDVGTQAYIDSVVNSLFRRVPAKSFFTLNISEVEGKVMGTFTVTSTTVKFESVKKSSTAKNAIDLIYEDIDQQIELWNQGATVQCPEVWQPQILK